MSAKRRTRSREWYGERGVASRLLGQEIVRVNLQPVIALHPTFARLTPRRIVRSRFPFLTAMMVTERANGPFNYAGEFDH